MEIPLELPVFETKILNEEYARERLASSPFAQMKAELLREKAEVDGTHL